MKMIEINGNCRIIGVVVDAKIALDAITENSIKPRANWVYFSPQCKFSTKILTRKYVGYPTFVLSKLGGRVINAKRTNHHHLNNMSADEVAA